MRVISERDLAVVIPLLAAKIRELTVELHAGQARDGELTGEEPEDRMRVQEIFVQYDGILDSLRSEYEAGLAEGIELPAFDELTRRFDIEPAPARRG